MTVPTRSRSIARAVQVLACCACASALLARPSAAEGLARELVASGLQQPVALAAPPGDVARLFVVEQHAGRIRIVRDGAVLPQPFLDLSGVVDSAGFENGLLSLAFHPDHATNGHFFVGYTAAGASYLARYTVSADPDLADPASAFVLLGPLVQPEPSQHNAVAMAFGPEGKLWVALGDGGGAAPGHLPPAEPQDGATLLGKLLRLDVDAPPPFIPPDNPFVGDPTVRNGVWALGLREPYGISFDPATGHLYVGDVGDASREEIDLVPADSAGGENFGWGCMEGTQCAGGAGCTCGSAELVPPIHEIDHAAGVCALIGGHVYRGCAIPDLVGQYVFADFCTGRFWSAPVDPATGAFAEPPLERTAEIAAGGGPSIQLVSAIGRGGRGELYVCDYADGELFRIVSEAGFGSRYCTGKTSSLGCMPFVRAAGIASATSSARFDVFAEDVLPDEAALLIYGFGRGNLSFHGAWLCVKTPVRRLNSKAPKATGAPPCSGVLRRNLNPYIRSGADPALTVGQMVNVQWRQRDPDLADGFRDSLTDGLEFIICD